MEVMLNKLLTFLLFINLLFGERIILERKRKYPPQRPIPNANLTLHFTSEKGTKVVKAQKFQNLNLYSEFRSSRLRQKQHTTYLESLNVLVLRVEFIEDDDPSTSGNGKMDLIGFGGPEDGLFYDPPHTKIYFERQMQFLSNYYKSNSFGKLKIKSTVKPDHPTRSYQLPHKMEYYSGFDHYDPETGFVWFNTYAMEMGLVRILADAIAAADQDASVDFSIYDEVIIFHAGTLMQTSLNFFRFRDIPSATIPSPALEFYIGSPFILANNGQDTIWGAGINAEMARVDEYMVGAIGTVVHEFGHTIGLPDLYDVSGWSNGVGGWDLMCTGGWIGSPVEGAPEGSLPANLGAWSRYEKGWVNPKVIMDPETLLTLRASEIDTTQFDLDSLTMIKIPISETEFFLIENRQQDVNKDGYVIVDVEDGVPISIDYGEYDFFLPGSGILVWHIDDDVIDAKWADNELQTDPHHKGVDLEEADGIQHFDAWWYIDSLEYFGSAYDPFFVDNNNKANYIFGPFTKPNSDSYYGKSMINIEVKSTPDTLMDFSLDFDIYQSGFPIVVRRGQKIQAVSYGDLDGNGDKEIITITKRGFVYAYNHDGTPYDSTKVDTATTFLSIGDISGDGAEDVIFGTGLEVLSLDGHNFTPLPGFPCTTGNEVLGAPLLFDINGDSRLEVIFGSKDRRLYCLDGSGSNIQNFPIYLNTELVSTPCVFNQSKKQIGLLGSDGRFWIIDKNGISKEFTESTHNMITYASPVVGDIDRDGNPEAVIINGYGTIYIYGEDSLEEKFDILIDTTFYFTPALADIDKDGYLEIIMPNSSKSLYVANRNGTPENNFPLHNEEFIFYPLLVADFDPNDGAGEQIVFGLGIVSVFETRDTSVTYETGELKIINNRNNEFSYSPLFGEGGFASPGVLFDLDSDGDLELACGTNSAKLYVWDFPGDKVSWSGYMNSPKNWGNYTGELVQPQIAQGLLGSFYMYPSPVERSGRFRFFLNQEADVRVDILDIVGHKIGGTKLNKTTANEYNEVEFDFSKHSNGIYIVRIEAKNGQKREVKFKKFAVLK
jgi:M6 family metalloprotease-like protein